MNPGLLAANASKADKTTSDFYCKTNDFAKSMIATTVIDAVYQ